MRHSHLSAAAALAVLAIPGLAIAQNMGGGPGGNPGPAAPVSALVGCAYNPVGVSPTSSLPQIGLQCDSSGNLKIIFPVSSGSVGPTSQAVPGYATYMGVNVGGILTGWTGFVTEADGANVVLGSLTDAASCASGQSILACLRLINTNVSGSVPAGAAIIGKVGLDQTTPGTTNAVSLAYINGTAATAGNGATSAGTQRITLSLDNTSVAFDVSTGTTTQIVAASGSTVIHVQHWGAVSNAAQTAKWVSADTGGSCANPVALTGVMSFAANGGASMGSGAGDVLVLPSGKALCLVTTTTGQTGGSVSYRQF